MGGDTSYFSDIFLAPGKDADAVSQAFSQMLATKYGYTGRVSCPLAFKTAEALKQLQNQHKPYAAQRAQQGRKIVETGWTYKGAPSLSTAEPPASTEAPPAAVSNTPKSAAPSAYEQALAAQRPRSVSQAQLAAAANTPAPNPNRPSTTPIAAAPSAGTTGEKYTFCYSTGSPYRGTAQSHYYITQPFPAPPAGSHPQDALQAYLRGQHRQESITGSTCSTPAPMSVTESTRRSNIENQRSIPNRAIVQLAWKPAS
jgi:hypothetical protein